MALPGGPPGRPCLAGQAVRAASRGREFPAAGAASVDMWGTTLVIAVDNPARVDAQAYVQGPKSPFSRLPMPGKTATRAERKDARVPRTVPGAAAPAVSSRSAHRSPAGA